MTQEVISLQVLLKGPSMQRLFLLFILTLATVGMAAEDWKGPSPGHQFTVGGLGGLAMVDGTAGFALLGNAGVKILNRGFVPDINDQVFLEADLGPVFFSGFTDLLVDTHLRWDFHKDDDWTFYALGGLEGLFSSGTLGHNQVNPRFGIGTIWELWQGVAVRAEVSNDLLALGITLYL